MKRSEINRIIRSTEAFICQNNFFLPPFAAWTVEDWRNKGEEANEIVKHKLGWDITDFGSGEQVGLVLFTLRNGDPQGWKSLQGKLYAEKLLIVGVNQRTPMHFHWNKTEDIINRSGGTLAVQVYSSTKDEDLDLNGEVRISTDGVLRVLAAGSVLMLRPGESVTLTPGMYHQFWGVGNRVLVGEVSMVNDDEQDNRFHRPAGRFPEIEEDEPPLRLLCTDYPTYFMP
jgi:D-lyxose ketol-isomerase